MDYTARCKAMAAFCSQRARMEDESEAESFWLGEAEAWTARLNRRVALAVEKQATKTVRRRVQRRTSPAEVEA